MNVGQLKFALQRIPDHVDLRILDHKQIIRAGKEEQPELIEVRRLLDHIEDEGTYLLLVGR